MPASTTRTWLESRPVVTFPARYRMMALLRLIFIPIGANAIAALRLACQCVRTTTPLMVVIAVFATAVLLAQLVYGAVNAARARRHRS